MISNIKVSKVYFQRPNSRPSVEFVWVSWNRQIRLRSDSRMFCCLVSRLGSILTSHLMFLSSCLWWSTGYSVYELPYSNNPHKILWDPDFGSRSSNPIWQPCPYWLLSMWICWVRFIRPKMYFAILNIYRIRLSISRFR